MYEYLFSEDTCKKIKIIPNYNIVHIKNILIPAIKTKQTAVKLWLNFEINISFSKKQSLYCGIKQLENIYLGNHFRNNQLFSWNRQTQMKLYYFLYFQNE